MPDAPDQTRRPEDCYAGANRSPRASNHRLTDARSNAVSMCRVPKVHRVVWRLVPWPKAGD
jgi:hypothetical protein